MEEKKLKKAFLERAKAYVPEWQQNEDSKDLGMALVELFSHLHADTLHKYELRSEKSSLEMLNALHSQKKPATAAKGYCTFGLSSEDVAGTGLKKASLLRSSKTRSDGSAIALETTEDVFVGPWRLDAILESDRDYIGELPEGEGFSFLSKSPENQQKHVFYLSHPKALSIASFGEISLTFYREKDVLFDAEDLDELLNLLTFSYSTGEGFTEFTSVTRKNHSIVLEKSPEDMAILPMELGELNQCFLRLEGEDAQSLSDFAFSHVLLSSSGTMLAPEDMNATGMQVSPDTDCYPFTEKPTIYDEMYFASDEALSKSGAMIELSFLLDFEKTSLEVEVEEETTWKLVMSKNKVKKDPVYDITIKEVVFEYFNGKGYVNLFKKGEYKNIFSTENGTHRQKVDIRFLCPMDIVPSIVGGVEAHYLRIRVLKINNSLKPKGVYIAPKISQPYFSYRYPNFGMAPEYIIEENMLEEHVYHASKLLGQISPYRPIRLLDHDSPALYLGFSKALDEGPIRILFHIKKTKDEVMPALNWEMHSEKGFVPMNVSDETENFRHSGLVSFGGLHGHSKTKLFGKEGYFLRISPRKAKDYDKESKWERPQIMGIYPNSASVIALETGLEQYLTLDDYEDSLSFGLDYQHISEASVYVNETETLSPKEEALLQERIDYREENGRLEKWVLWEEVDRFSPSKEEKRVFTIDLNAGILNFSKSGILPAPKIHRGIHVVMSSGGGLVTNLSSGDITGLDLSTGFITKAHNPLPLFGGNDEENLAQAKERTWASYKHKSRAVTPKDYESIVSGYARDVAKVQCFKNTNSRGEFSPGDICLVVLGGEHEKSSHYFPSFRQELLGYLKDKVSPNLLKEERLHIVPPNFVKINVSVDVQMSSLQQHFEVKEEIKRLLQSFLDPITGNFSQKGFAIGTVPNRKQMESLLREVKEIDGIKNLLLMGEITEGEKTKYLSMDEMENRPFVLPLCGEHQIQIFVE